MRESPVPSGDRSVRQPQSAAGGPISHAIFRVARLHRMLAGALLRETGLYPNQELVMMQLWDLGAQRQSELIRLLDSDASTMTRTIQRLERAGFVRRRPDPTDGRATLVEPTPASMHLRRRVEAVWAELERLTVGEWDESACRRARTVLDRLEHNLVLAASALDTSAEGVTAEPRS